MKFTSIKQIPKEAIEMIDDVQWWENFRGRPHELEERLDSQTILTICNYHIKPDGSCAPYYYIEPHELDDKTYGINLYKKIHGEG
jgi:hypothetical protein